MTIQFLLVLTALAQTPGETEVSPQGLSPVVVEAQTLSVEAGQFSAYVVALGRSPSAIDLLSLDGATAVNAANIELGYAVTDFATLRLLLGGTMLASRSTALWGFNIGGGVDFYFRKRTDRVRPMFGALVRFEKYVSTLSDDVALSASGRFGAAVFPWPFLAVKASAGIDVPMQLRSGVYGLQLVPFELGMGVFF